jgi:methionine-gamma-lyase
LVHHLADADQIVAGQVFASGMAAISAALLGRLRAGDSLVAQQSLYGHTSALIDLLGQRLGVEVIWVTDLNAAGWEAAFRRAQRPTLAYAETPINPTLELVDLTAVAGLAHQFGAWLVVDNTFASPFCQRPLTMGADVVVHSTTKYLSGHGAVIGGAVVSRHPDFISGPVTEQAHLMGATPSPFDAWLTNLGLKTFELRLERHCANAQRLAAYLEAHPKVARVHYPGLDSHPQAEIARRQMASGGGMIAFTLAGGFSAAEALLDRLRVISLAVSLGNVDSLIEHPASMTHRGLTPDERERMGIGPGLLRFSVGIENPADLEADLEQALAAS